MRVLSMFLYRFLLNSSRVLLARIGFTSLLFAVVSLASPSRSVAAVSITVAPASVNLSPGGTQQFTATVTGAADTSVTWSIQQGVSGGAILASGLYTAPPSVGSYSVIATSNADRSQSATAIVSVCRIHSHRITESFSRYCDSSFQWDCALYEWRAQLGGNLQSGYIHVQRQLGACRFLAWTIQQLCCQNGKVLIAGGQSSGQATASAELYDPDCGNFCRDREPDGSTGGAHGNAAAGRESIDCWRR